MIKQVGPAQHHPTNRSLADFHTYWGENHGPLFANTGRLRGYIQHLTLPGAYGVDPAPTFDGVSMFWYDDVASVRVDPNDAEQVELRRAVIEDDAQLFDRRSTWPTHHKRASVTAEERVILAGETNPDMVKAVFIVAKLPGLTLNEFFDHWQFTNGPLVAEIPGLRRYVQNHAVPAAYVNGNQTHDGFAELWFDDLAALHKAAKTPEWKAAQADGETLFGNNVGIGVAIERVQKDPNATWKYRDWGVPAMDEKDIRKLLKERRYGTLVDDPDAPAKIKRAASNERLAVFTDKHIVTYDDSRIDVRPDH